MIVPIVVALYDYSHAPDYRPDFAET